MKKQICKFFSLLLVLTIFLTCFSGCKSSTTASDSSTNSENSSDIVDSQGTDSDSSENKTSSETNSSDKNDNSSQGTSSVKIDLNAIKGTEITVLMWRDLALNEAEKIANFEKKYGVTVNLEYTTAELYNSKLTSMVTNKRSPDVAVISDGLFPLGAQVLFQPVEVTGQDLSDSVWNKKAMEAYKIKGKEYAFLSHSNWYTCSAIVLYNKDLFNDLGIETPLESFNAGTWNWDKMEELALKVLNAGKADGNEYIPCYGDNNFGKTYFLKSTGNDFVTKNGDQYTSILNSSTVINAFTKMTKMGENGTLVRYNSAGNFYTGKMAMLFTNIWATLLDGGFGELGFNAEYVPFPNAKGQKEIIIEGFNKFGIPKGSKNPVAAGLFLKYFLDSANNPSYNGLTNCPNSESMFKYITSKERTFSTSYGDAILGYSNLNALNKFYDEMYASTSSQVTTILEKNKSLVTNAVNNVNKKLS